MGVWNLESLGGIPASTLYMTSVLTLNADGTLTNSDGSGVNDGFWFVEDLCSNNTTFINDLNHPLNRSRAELKPGTQIIISHSIILTFRAR